MKRYFNTTLVHHIAELLKVSALLRRLNKSKALVVAYHGIYDESPVECSLPPTFVYYEDFKKQVCFFRKHYTIISPQEFLNLLLENRPFPPRSMLISFDDGYESYYRLAEPYLRPLGIRAAVFLPTHYINQNLPFWFDLAWVFPRVAKNKELLSLSKELGFKFDGFSRYESSKKILEKMKRLKPCDRDPLAHKMLDQFKDLHVGLDLFYPMSWSNIKELASRGTDFGSHSHTHTILSMLTSKEVEEELFASKEIIEDKLGKQCSLFAYPNGGEDDFTERDRKILANIGFKAAFCLQQQLCEPKDDPFAIKRVCVAQEDTIESLSFRCAAYTKPMKRLVTYFGKNR